LFAIFVPHIAIALGTYKKVVKSQLKPAR